ncbi:hypothetical protein K505DRAFT_231849 [Melanomma pulvis-pyrius CBS 109.77]|uniref:Na+/solute symporter n=1 Tax=Melanomma pulvis-pyrius CBS 109.77 TaxID=1314802 RepID=A0A6A6XRK2_9PLEO|nr:hypothetical protein K505DRAFT_231849 [Melanomma pulvis-pyrius CBS 109.77]
MAEFTLLSQGVGYGVVIGLGAFFAIIILLAVKIQKDYLSEDSGKSEMFLVANRTVGTGLTCSAVFSSWMWINETVFSCIMCYYYGIAAPMWFGTGLSFQIAVMALLGVLVKIRAPNAHTSLEIVRRRYASFGHIVFIVLNLINNILGCATMIVTGSQLVNGITGVHIAAATILIPFGVVIYTAVGGLKATFLTDFLHTAIALILIIYFTISVLTNEHVGGLDGLYDKLQATAGDHYIKGNFEGSLITFKSKGAILFGIVLKFGNLALVVMDTAFWQKSFASEVRSTVPGYNLAALAIFAIPWALGTVIGLSARVLEKTPGFVTYPDGFTAHQVGAGFVFPYTIHSLLGPGATAGFLLLLFMSVTSTVSSSMIAVSSILSFDIYRTYVNPRATDRQIVTASHLGVLFHGVFITGITLALNYGGADLTWLAYCMPILTSPGIFPMIFTLFWSRQSKIAAIASPILGMLFGIIVWLSTSKSIYHAVDITTTGMLAPAVYGGIASLFSPILFSVLISYFGPKELFDWNEFLRIDLVGDHLNEKIVGHGTKPAIATHTSSTDVVTSPDTTRPNSESKEPTKISSTNFDDNVLIHPFDASTLAYLNHWYKIAWAFLIGIVLITFLLWPIPLYRDWVFTKPFFRGWVVFAIIWQFFALGAVVVYPVYDGWSEISRSVRGILKNRRL